MIEELVLVLCMAGGYQNNPSEVQGDGFCRPRMTKL